MTGRMLALAPNVYRLLETEQDCLSARYGCVRTPREMVLLLFAVARYKAWRVDGA